MKICFPAEIIQGMNSTVYGHFGSAPGFVIVDTESMSLTEIQNGDQHHAHGMCQPLKALGGKEVDAVVVAAIGMGALMGSLYWVIERRRKRMEEKAAAAAGEDRRGQ